MPTLRRDTGDLYYEVHGTGPAVVLGHSFLCSGEMWGPQVGPLSESYRVLNLDLRGHGRSASTSAPVTLYDLVDDVLAVLDQEGVERAVWGGLSIGGMVALRAALVAPDRVAGLMILDSHAGSETTYGKLKFSVMGAMVRLLGARAGVPEICRIFFSPDTRRTKRALIDEWRQRFGSIHVPSIVQVMGALRERDSVVPRLGEIGIPALVIVGADDLALPPAYSREIAAGLRGSRLVEVEKAGHLSTLERPDVINPAMLGFLERHFTA